MHNHFDRERDLALWTEFLDGNNKAFGTLYVKYYDILVRDAGRKGLDRSDAEDVVSDTMMKLFENEPRINRSIRGMFFSRMRGNVSNFKKTLQNRERIRRELVLPSLLDKVEQVDKSYCMLLQMYMMRLAPTHRQIIELDVEGYNNAEIAEKLGKTKDYIRRQKHVARCTFKKLLVALPESLGFHLYI